MGVHREWTSSSDVSMRATVSKTFALAFSVVRQVLFYGKFIGQSPFTGHVYRGDNVIVDATTPAGNAHGVAAS